MREKNESLPLRNRLREVRTAQGLSQSQLADMVGVSRNTISSIETGQFSPTAKLTVVCCLNGRCCCASRWIGSSRICSILNKTCGDGGKAFVSALFLTVFSPPPRYNEGRRGEGPP